MCNTLQADISHLKQLIRKIHDGTITDDEFGEILPLAAALEKRTDKMGLSGEELRAVMLAAAESVND